MARTAVDLPDPLQSQGDGGASNNADDLLAQLAGEEVDRLLSEADVPAAPLPAAPPAAPLARPAAAPIDAADTTLDDLFQAISEANESNVAAPSPPVTPAA